jgi:broad specificity phosphatase PhoE
MELDSPKILVFVARHGETSLNKNLCFRGNANPPLNEKGIRQAHKLAELFEHIDVAAIVCSDKVRATKTAEIIAARKGVKVHSTPSLRALNVGDFSGKPRNKENTDALQYYIDRPDEPIPGGESLNQFKSRIKPCVEEALEIAQESGKPLLTVAHSSIVHEISSLVFNDHKHMLVEPGGVLALFMRGDKLSCEAIYKPVIPPPTDRADTVS